MLTRSLMIGGALLMLSGCATDPKMYADQKPEFRIEKYFAGHTRAWGMVQNRSGEVTRRFVVDMNGAWEGEDFVLTEDFTYNDGEKSTRVWRIRPKGEHDYEGRAADINGVAEGHAYGNALNWHYSLNVTTKSGSTWAVTFNDWMYLQDNGVMINRAEFSKFGIRLGEVTIAFVKSGMN